MTVGDLGAALAAVGSSTFDCSGVPGREVGVWKVAEDPEEGEVVSDPNSFRLDGGFAEFKASVLEGAEVTVSASGR